MSKDPKKPKWRGLVKLAEKAPVSATLYVSKDGKTMVIEDKSKDPKTIAVGVVKDG